MGGESPAIQKVPYIGGHSAYQAVAEKPCELFRNSWTRRSSHSTTKLWVMLFLDVACRTLPKFGRLRFVDVAGRTPPARGILAISRGRFEWANSVSPCPGRANVHVPPCGQEETRDVPPTIPVTASPSPFFCCVRHACVRVFFRGVSSTLRSASVERVGGSSKIPYLKPLFFFFFFVVVTRVSKRNWFTTHGASMAECVSAPQLGAHRAKARAAEHRDTGFDPHPCPFRSG